MSLSMKQECQACHIAALLLCMRYFIGSRDLQVQSTSSLPVPSGSRWAFSDLCTPMSMNRYVSSYKLLKFLMTKQIVPERYLNILTTMRLELIKKSCNIMLQLAMPWKSDHVSFPNNYSQAWFSRFFSTFSSQSLKSLTLLM